MRTKITIEASVAEGTDVQMLNDRISQALKMITNPDRCDMGLTRIHSVTSEPTSRLSEVAMWCRGLPCKLDGEKAKITGWGSRFATIASIESPKASEFSWATVNRVMKADGHFKIY